MNTRHQQSKEERVMASQKFQTGEWFTACDVASLLNIRVQDVRNLMSHMRADVDKRTVDGKIIYRKRSAVAELANGPWRKERDFGEVGYSPSIIR